MSDQFKSNLKTYLEIIQILDDDRVAHELEKRIQNNIEELVYEMAKHEDVYHSLINYQNRYRNGKIGEGARLILDMFNPKKCIETLKLCVEVKKLTGTNLVRDGIYAKTATDRVLYQVSIKGENCNNANS